MLWVTELTSFSQIEESVGVGGDCRLVIDTLAHPIEFIGQPPATQPSLSLPYSPFPRQRPWGGARPPLLHRCRQHQQEDLPPT